VLTSEEDRNGNTITLAYNAEKQLESATDSAGRKLIFKYNGSGEVESVKDPMGHTVKYTYESGNLASVTQLGETKLRWQFKYNSAHELTSETDGREHTVITEYNEAHQVSSQTDAMSRKRTWKYATIEGGTETTITEPNGATTVEKFNEYGSPTSVTHASGTSIAATTTSEYNEADELIATVDPNKHKTEYSYDFEGNRISEKNADGDEKKWTYDSAHDIDTETTPDGETTTIKRNVVSGDPEVIERPAPGSATQKTTYKYDAYGDRTAEIDPEGNKRTWGYNEDSQEISTVSPRGNVTGGEPAKFTTTIERNAEGQPLVVTEPEYSGGKPSDKTQSTISGQAQEGQTLSAGAGIWEGASSLTYTYQWEHCNTLGEGCSSVSGATSSIYALGNGDVGDTLRVVVTATNSFGSAASTSEATAVITTSVPAFSFAFGSKGTGGGQIEGPQHDGVDDHGDIWVTDYRNARIDEFSSSGTFMLTVGWGVKNGKAEAETCTSSCQAGIAGAGGGQFEGALGIVVNQSTGNVYVTDDLQNRVDEFSSTGALITSFGSYGTGGGQFRAPEGIAIDPSGNLWIAEPVNDRIDEFSSSGTFMLTVGWGVKNGKAEAETCTSSCQAGIEGSGNGQMFDPSDVALSGTNVYVSDYGNNRVDEFSSSGAYVSKFGSEGTGSGEFERPYDIAADPRSGDLYVADTHNDRVEEFSTTGVFLAKFGSEGSGNGQFLTPEGITVNSSGDVYVCDHGNNRIEEWEPVPSAPVYTSQFGTAGLETEKQLKEPRGVVVTAGGNVDVLDTNNDSVEEFSATGTYYPGRVNSRQAALA